MKEDRVKRQIDGEKTRVGGRYERRIKGKMKGEEKGQELGGEKRSC